MPYLFEHHGSNFSCHLKQYRCEHVNPNTKLQCKRKQYIGFDLCYQHLKTDHNLKIAPSTIPKAGKGLFAFNAEADDGDIVFSKDERIIDYNAQLITLIELNKRYGNKTAPYAVQINKNLYEDAGCVRSAGSIANHKPRKKTNAKLYAYRGKTYLKAIKNIKNGDEIFVNYGTDYELDVDYKTKYVRS
jgi:hypothetical protein